MCKYPKTTGYWVYTHRTPDNMYYVGVSQQQPSKRWQPSHYRTLSLELYIDQYGWNNIEHLVVKDALTEEQAIYWEERFIQMYTEMGCCINQRCSGYIYKNNKKEYKQQYQQQPEWKEYKQQYNQQYNQRPEVKEYHRQYDQQYNQRPERKVYNRVAAYNQKHYNRLITPLEAKEMYLLTGYIPDFIKKDDLF